MKNFSELISVITRFFGQSLSIKAIVNIIAIITAFWAGTSLINSLDENILSVLIHLFVSLFSITICFFVIYNLYEKIYGRVTSEVRIFRHPMYSYRLALIKAIRLSVIDDSYLTSILFIKLMRILYCLVFSSILFINYHMNNHSHKFVIHILEFEIVPHSLLDSTSLLAIVLMIIFAIWQMIEVSLIARGTARLVNKRSNAIVRRRSAKRKSGLISQRIAQFDADQD